MPQIRNGQACISLRQVHQAQVGVGQNPTTMKHTKHDSVADPTVSAPDLAEQREEVARAHARSRSRSLRSRVEQLERGEGEEEITRGTVPKSRRKMRQRGGWEEGLRCTAASPRASSAGAEEGGGERWRLCRQSSSPRLRVRGGRRPRRRASCSRRGSSACGHRSQASRRRGDELLGEVGGAVLPADGLSDGGEDLRVRTPYPNGAKE